MSPVKQGDLFHHIGSVWKVVRPHHRFPKCWVCACVAFDRPGIMANLHESIILTNPIVQEEAA